MRGHSSSTSIETLVRTRDAFVTERHLLRARYIPQVDPVDAKSVCLDKVTDGTVEVTAAGQSLPRRFQAILPLPYAVLRSQPVLREHQAATRPQDASYLAERI